MASVEVVQQSHSSTRARSVTSSMRSSSSVTSLSSRTSSAAPEDSRPGQSSYVELPLTHESSQFDVLDTKDSRTLEVRDLQYQVTERGAGFLQRLSKFQNPCRGKDSAEQKKTILKEISFRTQSGQMLAILGSSGSGKTTLLDVIACQTFTGEISGSVLLDGEPRTADTIKACSAYVRQDDRLLPHLTVRETLSFVAQLKLPPSWSKQQRDRRVDAVIAELGLRHVAGGKVGGEEIRGISGGERRRVSIGIQLLLDPSVLFLDEPTSGLDSFTAHNLVETLAKLARNNRIVVMTIHQPRSDIFELFDVMMLLTQGQMVYFGKQSEMVNYFSVMGYPCPELTNPCDYYVDLSTVDHKSEETEAETEQRVGGLIELYRGRESGTGGEPPRYSTHDIEPHGTDTDSVKTHSSGPGDRGSIASSRYKSDPDTDSVASRSEKSPESKDPLPEVVFSDVRADVQQVLSQRHKSSSQTLLAQKQAEAGAMSFVNQGFVNQGFQDDSSEGSNWQLRAPEQLGVWSEQRRIFRDPYLVVGHPHDKRTPGDTPGVSNYPLAVDMVAEDGAARPAYPIAVRKGDKSGLFLQFWVLIRRALRNNLEDYGFLVVQAIEALFMSIIYIYRRALRNNLEDYGFLVVQAIEALFMSIIYIYRRTLRNNLEDYGFLVVQAIEALFMSIIIGIIYLDLGLDQTGARDRFGLLYVLAALYPYMVILDVLGKYYKERFILYYEMLDDLYSAGPYFFAKVLGDVPEHTVFIIFYCLPVYFLSGLQMDAALFFQVFAVLYILVLCSRALALWAGSLFSAYAISVIFAQSIYSMFLLSSGFIFNLDNLFVGMKWVSHISYLKWGYQAMCITEFVGLNFTCTSPVPESCLEDGEDALQAYSLDGGAVWQSSLVITAEIIVFFVLFFVSVRFISQKPHQQ